MATIIYHLCMALQGLFRRLSLYIVQNYIDRESEWVDAEELDSDEMEDARFLRFQLIQVRAENTELQNQVNDLWMRFSELLQMPLEQLREYACRYEVQCTGGSWQVVVSRCVFCGCGVEVMDFSIERDALLYAALLQAVKYQPKHNLSCTACYEKYEKTLDLKDD